MYNWGSTCRFSEIYKFRPLTLILGIQGFFNVRNTNLVIKNHMMYSWGSTRRFSRIIQFRPLALKLGIYGFYDVRNKNILMKKSWNVELRVYMSIFPKTSNWSPDLEIPVIRVFRPREHEYGHGKFHQWTPKGHVHTWGSEGQFSPNFNLLPQHWIWCIPYFSEGF